VNQAAAPENGRALAEHAYRALRADMLAVIRRRVKDPAAAEDVLQDALIRIQERAGSLRDHERVDAWVKRIAANAAIDHLRRDRREVPEEMAPEASSPAGVPHDENLNVAVASWLLPMMGQLTDEDREALDLVDVGGMRQGELADKLGLSPSGARTRVQRARKRLAKVVTDCCALEQDRRGNVLSITPREDCCD